MKNDRYILTSPGRKKSHREASLNMGKRRARYSLVTTGEGGSAVQRVAELLKTPSIKAQGGGEKGAPRKRRRSHTTILRPRGKQDLG